MATDQLLEQIIEAVQKLDETRQREVLQHINGLQSEPGTEIEAGQGTALTDWLAKADASLDMTLQIHGADYQIDVRSLLDEIREEPTDERLGRR